MRKNKSMLGRYFFVLFLFTSLTVSGQISKKFKVNFADSIEKKEFIKCSRKFVKVELKGAALSNKVGKPDLPSYFHTFYVPKGQFVTGVNLKCSEAHIVQLKDDVKPAQHLVLTSMVDVDTTFDQPDATLYNTDSAYPSEQASISAIDFVEGDIQLVTIQVYPVLYYHKSKKMKVFTNYDVSLKTSTTKNTEIYRQNQIITHKHDQSILDLIKTMVENPSDIPTAEKLNAQIVTSKLKSASSTSWSVDCPFFEYVIITSKALKPAFQELVTWKKRKGYNAGIVCIEDILDEASGDVVSHLYDDAGKLRQYLQDGFDAEITKYALLGGGANIIPIRYGCGTQDSWTYKGKDVCTPTDLYYSDLNGNWNVDGDEFYGEESEVYNGKTIGDQVELGPEIYVGRVMCKSKDEVSNWIEKLKKYEQNPGNGDYAYLSKWLATTADDMQRAYEADTVKKYLPSFFTTKTIIKELPDYNWPSPYYPKGADVIAKINEHWGIYSNFNHGGPFGYGVATEGLANPQLLNKANYNVNFISNLPYDATGPGRTVIPESNNGFDKLTNINYPTIIYSTSCQNIPFDGDGTPSGWRNLGEAFLGMYKSGGGPAYLGYTRDTWFGYSYLLYQDFVQKISVNNSLGIAESFSKYNYNRGAKHKLCLGHNILGCPETQVWTATPSTFSPTFYESGSEVTVFPLCNDVKVTVISALDNGASYFNTQPVSGYYTFLNVPKPYYVTITKPNYIPYLKNPGAVLIENKNLTSTYLNCTSLSAGYSVDPAQNDGNVVVVNGQSVTFDVTGDIILAPGFEVQLGATFEAK